MTRSQIRRVLIGGVPGLISRHRRHHDVARFREFLVRVHQACACVVSAILDLLPYARRLPVDIEGGNRIDTRLAQAFGDMIRGFAETNESDSHYSAPISFQYPTDAATVRSEMTAYKFARRTRSAPLKARPSVMPSPMATQIF